MEAEKYTEIRELLRSWYLASFRKLPWRERPSVYKTLVSEFMLQQTQIITVVPYFERWMQSFPDLYALAKASEAQVLKHWEGLGYYSRARNLHRLAQDLVSQYPDLSALPQDAKSWLSFKGVGAYTSAAITSISFAYPAAVVDGNVIRILSRISADATVYKNSQAAVKSLSALANSLLDTQDPGTHNQAMMELGATVCFKRKPLCLLCPIRSHCQAFKQAKQEDFPKLQRPKQEKMAVYRAYIQDKDRLLLYQNLGDTKRLATLWEFPTLQSLNLELSPDMQPFLQKKRGISHQLIQEAFFDIPLTKQLKAAIQSNSQFRWLSAEDLHHTTLSGPHRKWLHALAKEAKQAKGGKP